MTDIVERLRQYDSDVDSPDVVYEAADEIERLRRDRTKVEFLAGHPILSLATEMLTVVVPVAVAILDEPQDDSVREDYLAMIQTLVSEHVETAFRDRWNQKRHPVQL